MRRRPVNCNGCGRFMIPMGGSVGPGGATRWYYCDPCNRETVVDEPETRRSGGSSSEPPAPSSTEEGTVSDAEPPEPKKSGGSDVKGE